MKRSQVIFVVALALLLAVVAACRLMPRAPGVSDLYSRYESQPGVRVGFVSAFRVDDTTRVDVTTIEALCDSGWSWMMNELDLQDDDVPVSDSVETGFLFRRVVKGKPSLVATDDCTDVDILLVSTVDHAAGIYHVSTQAQEDCVLRLAFDKYLNVE